MIKDIKRLSPKKLIITYDTQIFYEGSLIDTIEIKEVLRLNCSVYIPQNTPRVMNKISKRYAIKKKLLERLTHPRYAIEMGDIKAEISNTTSSILIPGNDQGKEWHTRYIAKKRDEIINELLR